MTRSDRKRRRRERATTLGAAIALILALGPIAPARAQSPRTNPSDRILSSIEAQDSGEAWTIIVRFAQPLRYVRHTPRGRAVIAVVEMELVGLERAEEDRQRGRESQRPFSGKGSPPLLEISATAGLGAVRTLELRFDGERSYEVSQEDDLRSLYVRIPHQGDPAQEARAQTLLAAAKEAMTAGDYPRAAQLYTKVLMLDAPHAHPEAQEMLGLAHERGGRRAHARAEYATFLERYPDHPDAPRVRQRLQAISTAKAPPPEQRRPARRDRDSDLRFDLHGSLSSYYSRSEIYLDQGLGDEVTDSSWLNDLYLGGRLRSSAWEVEATASGRARYDFEADEIGDDSRLNAVLVEAQQRGDGWWGNVGRQRGGGGITGRFDGARIGYRPNDRLDFHLLGGFPLKDYSSNSIDTDRFQVGGVGQVLDIYDLFDLELYSNYQNEDDLTYRAALGGQARHLREGRTIVASLDYDVWFNAVNFATLLADVEVRDGLSLNTLVEYRKSPILTLGNALIGQSADSISELHDGFSASQMKDLAEDRTADSTTYTLGARYELGDRFDLSGSATATRLSGTSSSGGVVGTPSTGYDFSYYAQIAGRALLMDRGISVVGLRVFDGDRRDAYMLQLNGRYPVAPKLRLNPIMLLEYVDQDEDQLRWVPRMRLDYTWKQVVFDLDVAFDMIQSVGGGSRPNEYGYSLFAGIRYDF
jgi:tetratricopeptide (TPR) repeat protein